jgi:hypothetical protein
VTKLNQFLAIEKSAKAEGERALTDAYQSLGKVDALFTGISREYQPRDDEGETLPAERTEVKQTVSDTLETVQKGLTRLFDVTLTKDVGNQSAKADIVVDGNTILSDVPVTYLLFLEKKLVDFRTFVSKLPTLDPGKKWDTNEALEDGVWASDARQTTRTKKVPRNHVLAVADEHHPAQVTMYHEDVVVGDWTTIDFSGAVPASRRSELLERVTKLQDAVKQAREAANSIDVTDQHAGEKIFGYLFS